MARVAHNANPDQSLIRQIATASVRSRAVHTPQQHHSPRLTPERSQALLVGIRAAVVRDCGFAHEANIAEHHTPGSLFQLYRTGNELPVLQTYLCADRATVANCAHRSSAFRPDPFLTEIQELVEAGILGSDWLTLATNLQKSINALDEQAAANRFAADHADRAPWIERSRPLTTAVRELQTALIQALETWSAIEPWHPPTCPVSIPATSEAVEAEPRNIEVANVLNRIRRRILKTLDTLTSFSSTY